MRILMILAAILFVVLSVLQFFASSPRTLTKKDLVCIVGGIDGYCCRDNTRCVGMPTTCLNQPQGNCHQQGDMLAGNRQDCLNVNPGRTCTTTAPQHVCFRETNCLWDTTLVPPACVLGNVLAEAQAPQACDDTCVPPPPL